jgi:hypothetical protein
MAFPTFQLMLSAARKLLKKGGSDPEAYIWAWKANGGWQLMFMMPHRGSHSRQLHIAQVFIDRVQWHERQGLDWRPCEIPPARRASYRRSGARS